MSPGEKLATACVAIHCTMCVKDLEWVWLACLLFFRNVVSAPCLRTYAKFLSSESCSANLERLTVRQVFWNVKYSHSVSMLTPSCQCDVMCVHITERKWAMETPYHMASLSRSSHSNPINQTAQVVGGGRENKSWILGWMKFTLRLWYQALFWAWPPHCSGMLTQHRITQTCLIYGVH